MGQDDHSVCDEQARQRAERRLRFLRSERDRLDREVDAGHASFRQLARADRQLRQARLRAERAEADVDRASDRDERGKRRIRKERGHESLDR